MLWGGGGGESEFLLICSINHFTSGIGVIVMKVP